MDLAFLIAIILSVIILNRIGAKVCNNCGEAIPADCEMCPECGQDPDYLVAG